MDDPFLNDLLSSSRKTTNATKPSIAPSPGSKNQAPSLIRSSRGPSSSSLANLPIGAPSNSDSVAHHPEIDDEVLTVARSTSSSSPPPLTPSPTTGETLDEAVLLTADQEQFLQEQSRELDRLIAREAALLAFYDDVTELQNKVYTREDLDLVTRLFKEVAGKRHRLQQQIDTFKRLLEDINFFAEDRVRARLNNLHKHNRQRRLLELNPEIKEHFERQMVNDLRCCCKSVRQLIPSRPAAVDLTSRGGGGGGGASPSVGQ